MMSCSYVNLILVIGRCKMEEDGPAWTVIAKTFDSPKNKKKSLSKMFFSGLGYQLLKIVRLAVRKMFT